MSPPLMMKTELLDIPYPLLSRTSGNCFPFLRCCATVSVFIQTNVDSRICNSVSLI